MKINRAMEGQHGETYRRTQVERFVEPIIVAGSCKVSAKLIESEYKSALPHHEHDSCARHMRASSDGALSDHPPELIRRWATAAWEQTEEWESDEA